MQLVLLSLTDTNTGEVKPCLSNAFSYRYDGGNFVPIAGTLTKCDFSNSYSFDNPSLEKSIFNRCSIAKSRLVKETLVVLRGLSNNGKEVYVCFVENNFSDFSEDSTEDKMLVLKNYVCGGEINGREFDNILSECIKNTLFTRAWRRTPPKGKVTFQTLDVENQVKGIIKVNVTKIRTETEYPYGKCMVAIWANPYGEERLCLCNALLFERDPDDNAFVTEDGRIMNILRPYPSCMLDRTIFFTSFSDFYYVRSAIYKEDLVILIGKGPGDEEFFLAALLEQGILKEFAKHSPNDPGVLPVLPLKNSIFDKTGDKNIIQTVCAVISHFSFTPVKMEAVPRYVLFTCYDSDNNRVRKIYRSIPQELIGHTSASPVASTHAQARDT
ncbi:hypothetical protein EDL79_02360 [Ehrlichia ruminantium]|uniref:Uncharacterized protein n=1 Tax=Ehrlichia ruminantium TaxID=779 RepID=A0AAE6QAU9_EHRRU|nr:hypothetical protein [Ehrlichia ruminantium]QGR03428.1 hypothetical protein EDL80_02455 [Ehrlichia ruminantium]QGR04340.1 hypothetical protein EDL79_02360 [Ehrlichia ruminantium]